VSIKTTSETFHLPVSLRIRGSVEKVFAAWTNPVEAEKWLCDRLEGEWAAGKSVYWNFGDQRQEIRIVAIEPNKFIKFRWNAHGNQAETEVQIEFKDLGLEVGVVLRESSWKMSREDISRALDAACGWENVFCRLKAWIEFGVKLR
jgi:uncharacterized protein YndB with AHSA1/START domain